MKIYCFIAAFIIAFSSPLNATSSTTVASGTTPKITTIVNPAVRNVGNNTPTAQPVSPAVQALLDAGAPGPINGVDPSLNNTTIATTTTFGGRNTPAPGQSPINALEDTTFRNTPGSTIPQRTTPQPIGINEPSTVRATPTTTTTASIIRQTPTTSTISTLFPLRQTPTTSSASSASTTSVRQTPTTSSASSASNAVISTSPTVVAVRLTPTTTSASSSDTTSESTTASLRVTPTTTTVSQRLTPTTTTVSQRLTPTTTTTTTSIQPRLTPTTTAAPPNPIVSDTSTTTVIRLTPTTTTISTGSTRLTPTTTTTTTTTAPIGTTGSPPLLLNPTPTTTSTSTSTTTPTTTTTTTTGPTRPPTPTTASTSTSATTTTTTTGPTRPPTPTTTSTSTSATTTTTTTGPTRPPTPTTASTSTTTTTTTTTTPTTTTTTTTTPTTTSTSTTKTTTISPTTVTSQPPTQQSSQPLVPSSTLLPIIPPSTVTTTLPPPSTVITTPSTTVTTNIPSTTSTPTTTTTTTTTTLPPTTVISTPPPLIPSTALTTPSTTVTTSPTTTTTTTVPTTIFTTTFPTSTAITSTVVTTTQPTTTTTTALALQYYDVMILCCENFNANSYLSSFATWCSTGNCYSSVTQQLLSWLRPAGLPIFQISQLTLIRDPVTGQAMLQFNILTDPKTIDKVRNIFQSQFFQISSSLNNNVQFSLSSGNKCSNSQIYFWTDYGNCPAQPCQNGGRCGLTGSDTQKNHFCACDTVNLFYGQSCENKQVELTPILYVPAGLGVLLSLLYIAWLLAGLCRTTPLKKLPAAVPPASDPVVKAPNPRKARSMIVLDELSEPARQLPEQTYYHAIGQAFPLVFNTSTYGRPSSAIGTSQKYFGSLGRRGARSELAPFGNRRPMSEIYYSTDDADELSPDPRDDINTLNKQYVVAYSDRTFNGRGFRDTSALRGYPY